MKSIFALALLVCAVFGICWLVDKGFSRLFRGTVVKKDRSLMNVPFVTDDENVNAAFINAATEAGLVNLKGHRSVGGMRASIYNAMPKSGVEALVDFMEDFEKKVR